MVLISQHDIDAAEGAETNQAASVFRNATVLSEELTSLANDDRRLGSALTTTAETAVADSYCSTTVTI